MKLDDPLGHNASVEKAARLLFAFNDDSPELGVMELSRKVGLNKSTASRFVATLVRLGLLERVDQGGKYRLGTRLLELGTLAMRHRPLCIEARDLLESLARETRDTAALGVAVASRLLFIQKFETSQSPIVVGQGYPLHCSAAGKVLLSGLDDAVVQEYLRRPLAKRTERSIISSKRLHDQIGAIRDVGYGADHEELEPGIASVAAPVYDRNADVVAAVVLSLAAHRLSSGSLPAIARTVCETAANLSGRLGYRAAITIRFPAERRGRGASASA
jgi:IclR family transcriptional regulator, KDG regulon repressor